MKFSAIPSLFLLFFYIFPANSVYSHPLPEIVESDSIRVGVVLSGGGAKGIAHIGVLKKLEEAGVRIDYITGTSMGSLVGALYSIGYTTDQLEEIAKSSSWDQLYTERPNRRYLSNFERMQGDRTIVSFPIRERGLDFPFGIISGQNIYAFLSRYTWPVHGTDRFENFPIPFATVATELETGEPKVFRSGYLPDAIRASISIPSLIRPHVIDGVAYIDGGLSNNLPVQEAKELGANFIISVNVAAPLMPTDSLTSFADVFTQVLNYRINEKIEAQIEESDIYISPQEANRFEIVDFDRVDELIQVGLDEADLYMDQFKEVAARQVAKPQLRPGIGSYGALPFNRVIISGNDLITDEFILSELNLEQGFQLTPDFIDEKINQLYSTQLFDLITYRIQPDESYYYNLHINVEENRTDVFRVGLRYETQTDASILLNTQFRNLLFNGSNLRFDLRLGDEIKASAELLAYGGLGSRMGIMTKAEYSSENIDQFEAGERTSRFKNHRTRLQLSVGNYLSSNNLIAGGIRRDFIYQNNTINPDMILPSSRDHTSYFFHFNRDRLHRKSYPTNGTRFVSNASYSGDFSLSNINYLRAGSLIESFFELSNDFSIRALLYGGYSSGDDLPWGSWYAINRLDSEFGFVRFGGFNRYELTSRNIQMASAGIQMEPIYHRFINFDFYIGRFPDEWDLATTDIVQGASISVGALTILGPVQVILSTSTENSFLAEFQIGYQF
ncbi:hypothetical protein DYD21_06315 [Rhodohalobacter sp. SW132]|uniref:patatin-like phospholipase family protein n=1 Tax=Rhodohalobacter sp. SW132 TaxID=2293433 RepID=UPI000E22C88F|nr:patatin-like phospholipase family protein [Rhodohalobacter sp. SW132]REL38218.1 hypothetical protein DYD21_06315 [Rhodohalobacter sp. SW132]